MKMSSWKNILFTFAAVMLPIAVLATAEVLLRISGIEKEHQELFIPVDGDEDMVAINPRFAGRYFSGFYPDTAPQPFRKEKPAGTRRYFVLGGSSAAGFPYNFYHGFPARLEEILTEAHPGEHLEVINLAMTAVNSYTLRDIHRRLPEFDPDGILIYAGHNEYYGAYGAGVVPGWMRPRLVRTAVLCLQDLHLVSLVTRLFGGGQEGQRPEAQNISDWKSHGSGDPVRSSADPDDVEAVPRTLMARMAAERLVHRDEPRFEEGIDHFEKNLFDILSTFRGMGVPVFISTVVSNKAGQQPLVEHAEADRLFRKASAFDPEQEPDSAMKYFTEAREQDPLRFRAPEGINRSIRELSRMNGVHLVDIHRITVSEEGMLPFAPSFFTDHLHLDYRGYAMIAGAFGRIMHEHGGLRLPDRYQDDTLLETARPDPLEELIVDYTLGLLKNDFPFVRNPEERTPQEWAEHRLKEYRDSEDPASRSAWAYITGRTSLADAQASLAGTYYSDAEHGPALRSLRALHYLQPMNPQLDQMILEHILSLIDRNAEGTESDKGSIENRVSSNRDEFWQETLSLLIRMKAQSFDDRTWPLIVEELIRLSRFDTARCWLEYWEALQPDARLYWYYAQWYIRQGENQKAQPYFREYYRHTR